MFLDQIHYPIIQAPMAGGAATPELAAAVCNAGGLGFLAGGYKTAEAMRQEIDNLRTLTQAPFGVNLFVPGREEKKEKEELLRYQQRIAPEARRLGVSLGEPRTDDDDWVNKLNVVLEEKVPVVSFTFGCPSPDLISRLKRAGAEVIVTVTTPQEALEASQAGADALCVQGSEAGGHRASFRNEPREEEEELGLLILLQRIRSAVNLPLIAAGGIMHGRDILAVMAAGARAAQLGTAFLRCPESGAHPLHKAALVDPRFQITAITRAFSGRRARGLANRFLRDYGHEAPAAYPQVHHLTSPLRKAAAKAGDVDCMALWAGQGHAMAQEIPAAELVQQLVEQMKKYAISIRL